MLAELTEAIADRQHAGSKIHCFIRDFEFTISSKLNTLASRGRSLGLKLLLTGTPGLRGHHENAPLARQIYANCNNNFPYSSNHLPRDLQRRIESEGWPEKLHAGEFAAQLLGVNGTILGRTIQLETGQQAR